MNVQVLKRGSAGDEVVETIPFATAVARIDELSARTIGAYCIGQAHANGRRHGSDRETCYVAAARLSPWRAIHGTQGFVIKVTRS